jgi:alpha-1,2-mannosyltransferase
VLCGVGGGAEEGSEMATTGADLRQRRKPATEEEAPVRDSEEEEKTAEKVEGPEVKSKGLGWGGAFCFLMIARYYSAMYNNIHDCDEVFNYWEPLHYLLYKSGFQTWEYRYDS